MDYTRAERTSKSAVVFDETGAARLATRLNPGPSGCPVKWDLCGIDISMKNEREEFRWANEKTLVRANKGFSGGH